MGKRIDLAGKAFGRLEVVKYAFTKYRNPYWIVKCICGNTKIVQGIGLKSGRTKSCGCFNKDSHTKHGMKKSREYNIWAKMKQRCLNTNDKDFKRYGGRGIIVCKSWVDSFENFYRDIGNIPVGLSIDRINNNLGYFKENIRFATPKEQANNRRKRKLNTSTQKTCVPPVLN